MPSQAHASLRAARTTRHDTTPRLASPRLPHGCAARRDPPPTGCAPPLAPFKHPRRGGQALSSAAGRGRTAAPERPGEARPRRPAGPPGRGSAAQRPPPPPPLGHTIPPY
ncbi:proline-rich protein HaeIII subfamily 1-like [Schistocerca piceifrons]|uniref:proline-rich protein HaeIII subfamily 1-like n=1 Tax=Schistocerca piceifrons TaxID=274613 RepID=UPI001F5F9D3B|nr:proline-rich protein HaeIII subfamily 1-like [Schistocerca piceifrons]